MKSINRFLHALGLVIVAELGDDHEFVVEYEELCRAGEVRSA